MLLELGLEGFHSAYDVCKGPIGACRSLQFAVASK